MNLHRELPKHWLPVLLLLLVVGVVAWKVRGYLQPVVELAVPSRGPVVDAVYATGVVEPVWQAKIAPLAAARLLSIHKHDGETVRAGEVLAQLDAREAEGNLAQQQARRDYAQSELARQQALVEKGFVSPSVLSKLVYDLKQADASVASNRRPLAETVLRSPINGIVMRQDGEAGEMVTAGQTLFWVGQVKPLRVTADVDEEDILRVKPGQKALLKADGLPGQALPATVAEITEKGDSLNKNYRVRLHLAEDVPLKNGMTVEVNILIEERSNALLVPNTSVKGDKVWVLNNQTAMLKPVKVGVRGQDKMEIISGLQPEEKIIISPAMSLKDGQTVRLP